MSFLDKLGRQIRGFRELRGYTQEQLAEKVGVATTTVSAWENGKFFLEYPSIQNLCIALEITEEDLFSFASSDISKSSTTLDEIIRISKQLTPTQQKQAVTILKSFLE